MLDVLIGVYRSFPVQLLLLHLRSNLALLVIWLLLLAFVTGWLGQHLGSQYLFLDPEYLGDSGYWPFLVVGLAFGFLVMSWNLSTYLLIGGYFGFLASLSRPFYKYCLNNALLPLLVLLVYCIYVWTFLGAEDFIWARSRGQCLSGLLLGVTLSLFLYAIYFNLTNRDISYYHGHRVPPPNRGPGSFRKPAGGFHSYRTAHRPAGLIDIHENAFRVRTYVTERLKLRRVRSVAHYDAALLKGIFRQNHLNALVLQFSSILLLAGFGIFSDFALFRLPAAASFLVLFSLVTSVVGFISYWFATWRATLLVLTLVLLNAITTTAYFQRGNRAYGLDYADPEPYNEEVIADLLAPGRVAADKDTTLAILETWRAQQPEEKPPLVLVCASGGGLSAAVWATQVVQTLQRTTQDDFLNRTALITGASGGMLAMATLREAYLDGRLGADNPDLLMSSATDLLNPIAFSLVSNDIYLPFTNVTIGDRDYPRDRAFAFEKAYNEITGFTLDKPLIAYRQPERRAEIPLLFVTPSVIDDGRRMVISPQGVSYMMATPSARDPDLDLAADMIDLRLLLRDQSADSLLFTSALRANATYPYVLPLVRLPTEPVVKLMDAGYRDNYGIASASRFIHVFQNWIREHTSGVILIQISVFHTIQKQTGDSRGAIESLIDPVGVAGRILSVQALEQESVLGSLRELLGPEGFQLFRFNYLPEDDDPLRASVSFHLTDPERRRILRAIERPAHQRELARLRAALR